MINDTEARLNDLQADLYKCRRAITYRGGEISATAGFKEVAKKIQTLPPSSSVGTVIDDASSLFKIVPVGSTKYCYLKSLGGMTYKCNNLLPFPYYGGKGVGYTETIGGITFTINADRSITINGTSIGASFLLVNYLSLPSASYTITSYDVGGTWTGDTKSAPYISGTALGSGTYLTPSNPSTTISTNPVWLSINVASGVTVNNVTLKIMLNKGSTALPYEDYYEGLKDNKATAIKVRGANLITFPYYSKSNTTNGITTTVNDDGSITVNGTATARVAFVILAAPIKISNKQQYTISGNCISNNWPDGVYIVGSTNLNGATGVSSPVYNYLTSRTLGQGDVIGDVRLVIPSGTVCSNVTFQPMINIGTTAVPYTPYHESITYEIPEALQGTGKGVEGASDTIDFENGKKITNIGEVYLKDLVWAKQSYGFSTNSLGKNFITGKLLCDRYATVSYDTLYNGTTDMCIAGDTRYYAVIVSDSRYTDVTSFVASLGDTKLYYAIAEPAETDIDTSAFDPLIEVEGGGSLEFITDNGGVVPSTIIYQTIT